MAKKVIESLVTELTADGAKFKKELDTTLKDAKTWGQKVTGIAATAAKGLAVGGAALTTAVGLSIKSVVEDASQIRQLSSVAGEGAEEFQRMAYATKIYGVEQDKLSDILKDTNDKLGDFFQTGAGPLADFFENIAPQIGVTADQFRDLSGSDALQLYVSSLEKANLSQSEMTFYMEAIASDATLLLPLLRNNGTEMERLATKADNLGAVLSEQDLMDLKQVDEAFAEFGATVDATYKKIAISLVPEIKDFSALLNDSSVQSGLTDFANLLIETGRAAVYLSKEVGEVYRLINGIDADNISHVDEQIKLVQNAITNPSQRLRFFGKDGLIEYYSEAELREELKKLIDQKNKIIAEDKDNQLISDLDSLGWDDAFAMPKAKEKAVPVDLNYQKNKTELLKNWEIEQQREMAIMLDKEKRAQEVADREVAIQRDKFARIHEEMLVAEDNVVSLEQFRYERAQKELQEEIDYLNEKGLLSAELELEFQMAKEEQEMAHQERLKNIKEQARQEDLQKQIAQLQGYEQLFGSMGDIFDSFGARQSKARRLLLIAEKAAAIKSATISINEGIANSARLGFPQNIAAIGATVAATAGLISNIESVGVAHGGLTNVPKEQTYFLDKGERVVSPKQNRDLTQFLDSSRAGGGLKIELINTSGVPMEASTEQDGDTLRVILTAVDNKLRTDLNAGRGVWREAKERFGWSVRGAF